MLDFEPQRSKCKYCRGYRYDKRGRPETNKETKAKICHLYTSGGTLRSVSESLGVSKATVYRILLSYGVPLHSRSRRNGRT
jgi:transposase-like protein